MAKVGYRFDLAALEWVIIPDGEVPGWVGYYRVSGWVFGEAYNSTKQAARNIFVFDTETHRLYQPTGVYETGTPIRLPWIEKGTLRYEDINCVSPRMDYQEDEIYPTDKFSSIDDRHTGIFYHSDSFKQDGELPPGGTWNVRITGDSVLSGSDFINECESWDNTDTLASGTTYVDGVKKSRQELLNLSAPDIACTSVVIYKGGNFKDSIITTIFMDLPGVDITRSRVGQINTTLCGGGDADCYIIGATSQDLDDYVQGVWDAGGFPRFSPPPADILGTSSYRLAWDGLNENNTWWAPYELPEANKTNKITDTCLRIYPHAAFYEGGVSAIDYDLLDSKVDSIVIENNLGNNISCLTFDKLALKSFKCPQMWFENAYMDPVFRGSLEIVNLEMSDTLFMYTSINDFYKMDLRIINRTPQKVGFIFLSVQAITGGSHIVVQLIDCTFVDIPKIKIAVQPEIGTEPPGNYTDEYIGSPGADAYLVRPKIYTFRNIVFDPFLDPADYSDGLTWNLTDPDYPSCTLRSPLVTAVGGDLSKYRIPTNNLDDAPVQQSARPLVAGASGGTGDALSKYIGSDKEVTDYSLLFSGFIGGTPVPNDAVYLEYDDILIPTNPGPPCTI